MTERLVLPSRRFHVSFEIEHWGQRFKIGLGRAKPGGSVLEVFLHSGRVGDQASAVAHDAAIILSVALQYGVPLEALSKSVVRDPDGKATSPIGAVIDHIVKEQNH